MLEGKALVVAVMMLTAAPIAATDQGQAFLGDVTYEIGEVFNDDEKETKVIDKTLDEPDIEDKKLLLTDDKEEVDCLTIEQWKKTLVPEEKVDEEREEKEGARGDGKENKETDEKKESDVKDWTDKKEIIDEDACLSAEEWALKFESGDDKEEPCFTIEDLEEKMEDERKHHKKGWGRIHHGEDKDWDREDNDWAEDEEFRLYLAELSEACGEGDEEACDELLEIREELVEDRDEEEQEERDEDDGARGDDEDEETDDNEDEEFRLYLAELAEACDEGDEEACDEFREIMAELVEDREENDRDRDEKDLDEDACLTMEEWKEVLGDDKEEKDERDWEDDRKEKSPHRDTFVREIIEELEYACEEENDEEACAELEELFAEFEEREGECDKERDDEEDESEQEESEEDETDEDESNDEDSEE